VKKGTVELGADRKTQAVNPLIYLTTSLGEVYMLAKLYNAIRFIAVSPT
jgi:hypothetical protein